jgi:hypothetical protein
MTLAKPKWRCSSVITSIVVMVVLALLVLVPMFPSPLVNYDPTPVPYDHGRGPERQLAMPCLYCSGRERVSLYTHVSVRLNQKLDCD